MTQINVTNRNFAELFNEVWDAFSEADTSVLETVYPTAVAGPGGLAKVVWPTSSVMALALASTIDFVKETKTAEVDTAPPGQIVRAVLEKWKTENSDLAVAAVKNFYLGGGK